MFRNWTSVFEITGATGAQLIGLLFVVVTLGTGLSAKQSEDAIRAFITPTLVNFSGVLFQAVVVLTPWPSERPAAVILILGGLLGLTYRIMAMRLKRKADFVERSASSWIAYDGVPILANLSVICGGVGLFTSCGFAPFAIAAGSALLLAAGIFGAWDVTLWILRSRKA